LVQEERRGVAILSSVRLSRQRERQTEYRPILNLAVSDDSNRSFGVNRSLVRHWFLCAIVVVALVEGVARPSEKAAPEGQVLRLSGHPGGVWSVAFTPDGEHILSSGGGYRAGAPMACDLRLWNVKTGKEVRRFEGHMGPVVAAAVAPDGRSVLSGSVDCTAQLWELETGKELRRFRHQGAVRTVAFAPDGRSLVTGSDDGTARRWETETGQFLQVYDRDRFRVIYAAAFSPDGRHVITGGGGNAVRIWDAATGKLESQSETGARVLGLTAAADSHSIVSADAEGGVWQWPMRGGNPIKGFSRATKATYAVALSSDSKYVAAARSDGSVRVWEMATGKEAVRFEGHTGAVSSVTFAPDGRHLASGGEDGSVCVWQLPRVNGSR
jgi:WD40 repeat protein